MADKEEIIALRNRIAVLERRLAAVEGVAIVHTDFFLPALVALAKTSGMNPALLDTLMGATAARLDKRLSDPKGSDRSSLGYAQAEVEHLRQHLVEQPAAPPADE